MRIEIQYRKALKVTKSMRTTNKVLISITIAFLSNMVSANDYTSTCEVDKVGVDPVAYWDFNAGESPNRNNAFVQWKGDHGGIKNIPQSELKGLEFKFKGKGPNGDSSSEFRYSIKKPLMHVWEKFSILQPENYYHRLNVRISPDSSYDPKDWPPGSEVNTSQATGKVEKADTDFLWINAPSDIYDRSWGEGKLVTNAKTGASFESLDSKFKASNNKLSAMWQGRYSNAALIVGYTSISGKKGGKESVGYCEFLGSKTAERKGFRATNHLLSNDEPVCFDPRDNGTIVDFVIERKRSTDPDIPNGIYAMWKRTENTNWELIFRNEKINPYQENNNYFDSGYIFGWSNSGFSEDTTFYLLNWGLWNSKPEFLPSSPKF